MTALDRLRDVTAIAAPPVLPARAGDAIRLAAETHYAPELHAATRRLLCARRLNWAPDAVAQLEQELLAAVDRVVDLLRAADDIERREHVAAPEPAPSIAHPGRREIVRPRGFSRAIGRGR